MRGLLKVLLSIATGAAIGIIIPHLPFYNDSPHVVPFRRNEDDREEDENDQQTEQEQEQQDATMSSTSEQQNDAENPIREQNIAEGSTIEQQSDAESPTSELQDDADEPVSENQNGAENPISEEQHDAGDPICEHQNEAEDPISEEQNDTENPINEQRSPGSGHQNDVEDLSSEEQNDAESLPSHQQIAAESFPSEHPNDAEGFSSEQHIDAESPASEPQNDAESLESEPQNDAESPASETQNDAQSPVTGQQNDAESLPSEQQSVTESSASDHTLLSEHGSQYESYSEESDESQSVQSESGQRFSALPFLRLLSSGRRQLALQADSRTDSRLPREVSIIRDVDVLALLDTVAPCTTMKHSHEGKCTICIDSIVLGQRVRITQCNHFFHASCLEQWVLYITAGLMNVAAYWLARDGSIQYRLRFPFCPNCSEFLDVVPRHEWRVVLLTALAVTMSLSSANQAIALYERDVVVKDRSDPPVVIHIRADEYGFRPWWMDENEHYHYTFVARNDDYRVLLRVLAYPIVSSNNIVSNNDSAIEQEG